MTSRPPQRPAGFIAVPFDPPDPNNPNYDLLFQSYLKYVQIYARNAGIDPANIQVAEYNGRPVAVDKTNLPKQLLDEKNLNSVAGLLEQDHIAKITANIAGIEGKKQLAAEQEEFFSHPGNRPTDGSGLLLEPETQISHKPFDFSSDEDFEDDVGRNMFQQLQTVSKLVLGSGNESTETINADYSNPDLAGGILAGLMPKNLYDTTPWKESDVWQIIIPFSTQGPQLIWRWRNIPDDDPRLDPAYNIPQFPKKPDILSIFFNEPSLPANKFALSPFNQALISGLQITTEKQQDRFPDDSFWRGMVPGTQTSLKKTLDGLSYGQNVPYESVKTNAQETADIWDLVFSGR